MVKPTKLDTVLASNRLPSLPAVARQVIALGERETVTVDEFTTILSADPALAARVVKTANSALYARSFPARTIREAVLVLGLRSVRALALGFSLVRTSRRGSTRFFDYERFWERCVDAACVARTLATVVGHWHGEEAFLGGLVHEIGVLALAEYDAQQFPRIFAEVSGSRSRLSEAEREAYGFDHAALGAALCERWALPAEVVAAVRWHLDPDTSPVHDRPYARMLGASSAGADVLTGQAGLSELHEAFWNLCDPLWHLSREAADRVLARAATDATATRALFDLRASSLRSAAGILSMANEQLVRLSLETEAETIHLGAENQELRRAATTDPLTGAANRRRCDEFLEERLQAATQTGKTLSLLAIDIDELKRINDGFGHQVGDLAVERVAEILLGGIRQADLVARVGGDEFVVVLPDAGRPQAIEIAERLRRTIATSVIRSNSGDEFAVTVSVGVAVYLAGSRQTASQLVRAADVALYAAKRAGRNRAVDAAWDAAA